MKKSLISLILMFSLAIGGCRSLSAVTDAPFCRVVTEITVQVENAPETGLCRYTTPNKMIKTLHCLRRLDPWDLADTDPELAPGPRYHFDLTLSDGSHKTYDLIGNSYLREGNGPWREVTASQALRIPLLLAAVPSDAI